MIAADDDRGTKLARGHHLVELEPGEVAFLVAEPTDSRGQALKVNLLLRLGDPPSQMFVFGEEFEDRLVGRGDVGRIARQGSPTERALAFAEQRADVGGHEAGKCERPVEAAQAGLFADGVSVVEDLGSGVHEAHHGADVFGHRGARLNGKALRIVGHFGMPIGNADALGEITQRVVGTGLIGDDVDRDAALQQFGEDGCGVADNADREGATFVLGFERAFDGLIQIGPIFIEVAVLDPAFEPRLVDVDNQHGAVVHRDGERLCATHPAAAAGQSQRAGEGSVAIAVTVFWFGGELPRDSAERFIRALQDALRADVDPRTGRHLPIHCQALGLEFAELWPRRPVADEVGVGDEHTRRPLVRTEHTNGFARLHEQRLVIGERLEGTDDRVVTLPVAGGLARAAIDNEVFGALGHFGVEVVHEHAHRRFGLPRTRRQGGAAGRANGGVLVSHGDPFVLREPDVLALFLMSLGPKRSPYSQSSWGGPRSQRVGEGVR